MTGAIAYYQAGIARVHEAMGDDQNALHYYDLALPVLLAQGAAYYALSPLMAKAEILCRRGDLAEARAIHEQGRALATEAELPEYVWRCRLLAARLDFAAGHKSAAIQRLTGLLSAAQEESQQAELNHMLWEMTGERRFARAAAEGYRVVYQRAPSHATKRRLEKLQHSLAADGDDVSTP